MFRAVLSCIVLSSLLAATAATAPAQPVQRDSASPADDRSMRFDVISIHPARPGEHGYENWGHSGFSAANVDLWSLILQAYFGERLVPRSAISGYPDWVTRQRWDIEAKVAPEDIAEYQKHEPLMRDPPEALGWTMLRSLLADRFHLAVHRVPGEMDGYALVVGKNGPKMKLSPPNEPQPPNTYPDHDGYIDSHGAEPRYTYYSFTMAAFAAHLHRLAAAVVDRTGLTGRYDFTMNWLSSGPDEKDIGAIYPNDPDPLSHWDLGALGLRAERVKLPVETVVVDHVEPPTEN